MKLDLIDNFYEKNESTTKIQFLNIIRKSPKAKYQIFDESEFTSGREVLGNLDCTWNDSLRRHGY